MVQKSITESCSQPTTGSSPTVDPIPFPSQSPQDVLTAILRDGAQRMLSQAIEAEWRAPELCASGYESRLVLYR